MRRWISFLAVLGVLLHAGAVVRHHIVMLGLPASPSAEQTLLADLQVICHGTGDQPALAGGDAPSGRTPADIKRNCPLCAGLAGPFALTAPLPTVAVRLTATQAPVSALAAVLDELPRTLHPPTRGPPLIA
jgi:hypothetical protein